MCYIYIYVTHICSSKFYIFIFIFVIENKRWLIRIIVSIIAYYGGSNKIKIKIKLPAEIFSCRISTRKGLLKTYREEMYSTLSRLKQHNLHKVIYKLKYLHQQMLMLMGSCIHGISITFHLFNKFAYHFLFSLNFRLP